MRIPHIKLIGLTLALGALVAYAFFTKIGPQKLEAVAREANPTYLAIAVALFISSYAFGALGMWYLLSKRASRGFLLKAYIVGCFLNNITPAAGYGGEIAKTEIISRRTQIPRTSVFAAVVIHKILHFAPFVVSLLLSAIILELRGALGNASFIAGISAGIAAVIGFMIMLFVSRKPGSEHIVCALLEYVLRLFGRIESIFLSGKKRTRADKVVCEFHTNAHVLFWRRQIAAPALSGTAGFLAEVCALYFVVLSLGQNITIPALMLSYTVAVFIGMIPITPGGLGTYEATLAWMLLAFGVPLSEALAATLLFRLIQYWMTNALGVLMLARINK